MKSIFKELTRRMGIEITRYTPPAPAGEVVTVRTEKEYRGYMLLSYTINPFLLKQGESFDDSHSCDWECYQIAQTFLAMGYNVDVINYNNTKFIPGKKYHVFIDVLSNMERIAPLLDDDCTKIYQPSFAHWLSHNTGEYERHLTFQRRKGILSKPPRLLPLNLSAEYAEVLILKGGPFTSDSYSYSGKKVFRIPIGTQVTYPWQESKDIGNCKKNYVWFGGKGLIHKGLDLVLETFAELPDYHLYICGPITKKEDIEKELDSKDYRKPTEKDFEAAYYKELYQTPNIHTLGWVDINGPEAIEILNNSIGIIYPSCSESAAGSVINCMHAGLIPIVSYETSVNVEESFGVILKNCSINEIKKNIQFISSLPIGKLRSMSRKAWEFARTHHTRERFSEEYKKVIYQILKQN